MTRAISIRPNRESLDYYEPVALLIPGREAMRTRLGDAVFTTMCISDEQNRTAALIVRRDKARIDFGQIRVIYRRADFPK
jgi:hypothetical protein